MLIQLAPLEARVIGCLIEKEITTPEQYPLSLGALTNACNQKSSRDPVLNLQETEVQNILDDLLKKHLVSDRSGFGSRVTKYTHRFCNVGFGSLEFTAQEVGIICVLLLRGAQTPGELRTRTNRLCDFSDVQETESVLQGLMECEGGPFVARLPREPGKRESRYINLFSETVEAHQLIEGQEPERYRHTSESQGEIDQLETLLLQMQERLDELEARIEQLEGRGH